MLKQILILSILINFALGGLWSDLRVTFGIMPNDTNAFQSLPLKEQDAIKAGWKLQKDCSQINGRRYTLNNDNAVLLVFNEFNGEIAGVASFVPKNLPTKFPSVRLQEYFQDEGENQ